MKRILSIDGGGIRGVIPARIVDHLERQLGGPLQKYFDLFAGTSTGGLIALGLALPEPKSGAELIKLYESDGPVIFSRSYWRAASSLGGLNQPSYTADGLSATLNKQFGESRFGDLVKPTVITSYCTEHRRPVFFKSWKTGAPPVGDPAQNDHRIVEIARATSAAPTFFPPLELEKDGEHFSLIDGGVYANNPALCAYAEARRLFPRESDFLVVSLGTGRYQRRYSYETVDEWGLVGWVRPVLSMMMGGQSDTVDYQLQQMLRSNRYFRFDIDLQRGNDDMDDASKENIKILKLLGGEIITRDARKLEELLDLLQTPVRTARR